MKTAALALFLALASAVLARADGGVILSRQTVNGLDVTVFASPAPLRAGPVDISVLIQPEGSSQPILDAAVETAWSASPEAFPAWVPPCCSMNKADRTPATQAHSQNKMLYSAMVPIKSSGPSKLLVKIDWKDEVTAIPVDISVGPPRAPLLAYWPCLAFPPLLIFGFALHQRLSRRKPTSVKE